MENYKIIKTKDLKLETIDIADMSSLKTLSKILNIKYKIFCRLTYPIFLFILICATTSLLLLVFEGFSIDEFISLLAYSFFLYVFYILNDIKKRSRKLDFKKAQYGIVSKKHFNVSIDDNNNISAILDKDDDKQIDGFYIDVIFPQDSTIMKNIKPFTIDYLNIKEGDSVLIVSYDNFKPLCILSKKNN